MRKSRLALSSAAVFGAGLFALPGFSPASSTYTHPLPNRSNGAGGQFGESYNIIDNVVITTGYENIQSASTTVPADAVTAPAIFFQINLNPGTVATPTDITSGTQWWADYEIGMETVPGAGLVGPVTTASNPYGSSPIGISTGMNYWIAGFNNKVTAPSTAGGNQVYTYSGAWTQLAGANQAAYNATSTVITPTSITLGIPLSDLNLSAGNTFNFDVWPTFGGNSAYDALDNPAFAPAGYYPYSNGAGTPTPYDSATTAGSNYATTTYTVTTPTLTWNDATAAAGFFDGVTWDVNDTTKFNWNNGIFADYYVDGSNVVFNDVNSSNYTVTLNTTVSPGSVVINNSSSNYVIGGVGGQIAGAGSLTKMGTSTATLTSVNTYGGGTFVSAGTLVVGVNGAMPNGSLSVTGGTLQLGASTGLARLTSLSITGAGVVDVNNNHMILTYGATDPASTIYNYLKTGYNGGAWTGPGIDSSAAALPANNANYGVGFVDGKDGVPGASVTSGQILIAYALYGDVNLDGLVNATDFAVFGANFNSAVTGWDKGDFTYTGLINATDFALLGANFGKSASGAALDLPASDFAALDAFAAANGLSLPSVPEPATAALIAVAGMGVLGKRRRRKGS